MFFPLQAQPVLADENHPGFSRQILAHEGTMMLVQATFKQGVRMPLHSHPHEQISYIVSGRFECVIGDQTSTLGAGDSYYVPSGVEHTVNALEDAVILDVFTPQREDFLQ